MIPGDGASVSDHTVTYTAREIEALRDFTNDSSEGPDAPLNADDLNNTLRAAQGCGTRSSDTGRFGEARIAQQIATIDGILAKTNAGSAAKLRKTQRGVKWAFVKGTQEKTARREWHENGIIRDPAFLSTSKVIPESLDSRTNFIKRGAQLTIFGRSGVDLDPIIGTDRKYCGSLDEAEVLYPRETRMRVLLHFNKYQHDEFETPTLKSRLEAEGLGLPDGLATNPRGQVKRIKGKDLSFSHIRSVAEEQGMHTPSYESLREAKSLVDIAAALPPRTAREARQLTDLQATSNDGRQERRWFGPESPFTAGPVKTNLPSAYTSPITG